VVEVHHLRKCFGSFVAVEDVSLHLNAGEAVGLLGPNGAGKTTVISMLLGLITPTAGTIRVLGRPMPEHRVAILQNCNFSSAYVNLPSNLKVIENLRIYARLYAIPDREKRIATLLDLFEIGPMAYTVTGRLSAGENARINLCKALLNRPSVLFLDEPTASLDPDMADKLRILLRRLQREEKITLLTTSHNMRDIEATCDRVLFLRKGRVLAEGTAAEIIARFHAASLEQAFIRVARSGDLEDFDPAAQELPL
jgi:ABC-2 type transport system ATP-binding protein